MDNPMGEKEASFDGGGPSVPDEANQRPRHKLVYKSPTPPADRANSTSTGGDGKGEDAARKKILVHDQNNNSETGQEDEHPYQEPAASRSRDVVTGKDGAGQFNQAESHQNEGGDSHPEAKQSCMHQDDRDSIDEEEDHDEDKAQVVAKPGGTGSIVPFAEQQNLRRNCDVAQSNVARHGSSSKDEAPGYTDAPSYTDAWDDVHLRMPCSPMFVFKRDGQKRWDGMLAALSQPLRCFEDLRSCILSYAAENGKNWKFNALQYVLNEMLNGSERTRFFNVVLPTIVKLAKALPEVCPTPIPILQRDSPASLSFTQHQCASLLANCFLCTFPRACQIENHLPSVNFFRLFESSDARRVSSNSAKIRCILRYFEEIAGRIGNNASLERNIVVQRRVLGHLAAEYASDGQPLYRLGGLDWLSSQRGFGGVELDVRIDERIEDFDPRGRVWQVCVCMYTYMSG